jgi:hypothetical protein
MLLHTTHRARNRRGVAAGEWTAMIVVFVLGAALGLWATGGLDMPQARASLLDFAQRSGVNLQPILGTVSNPVGAELRQLVANSQNGEDSTATELPATAEGSAANVTALARLVATAHEAASDEDTVESPKKNKRTAKKQRAAAGNAGEGTATLAYWNGLNSIMNQELSMRNTPTKVTADNANGFVESLASADQFAAKSIRELDTKNVDPEVVSLSGELAGWYEEGASLNGEATCLVRRDGSVGRLR